MVAYIFPGQGAQYVGMGRDLYERSIEARRVFDTADKTLGFSLSKLCFEGPDDKLKRTDICQVAIFTVSCAALEAFKARITTKDSYHPAYMSGLSLGEYTALPATETLGLEEVLRLVRRRGELMEEAAKENPGSMAAVLGLDVETVRKVCVYSGVEIANLNCPGQIVISGRRELVQKAKVKLEEAGASKVIFLEVSGAFHCSLMKEASVKLAGEIEKYTFRIPKVPLVSNVTGRVQTSADEIKQNLVKQMYSSVLWESCIRFISAQGVKRFYEIGPGRTLKGILRKIDPSLEVINIERYGDIENAG